jgi:hypothetical protein
MPESLERRDALAFGEASGFLVPETSDRWLRLSSLVRGTSSVSQIELGQPGCNRAEHRSIVQDLEQNKMNKMPCFQRGSFAARTVRTQSLRETIQVCESASQRTMSEYFSAHITIRSCIEPVVEELQMKPKSLHMLWIFALAISVSPLASSRLTAQVRDDDNRDRHDYDRDRGGPREMAARMGAEDGLNDGRKDRETGHSNRPTKGDNYKNATRGFSGGDGQTAYKAAYRQSYVEAYQRGYNEGRGRR